MSKKAKLGIYIGVTAVLLIFLALTVTSSISLITEKLDERNWGQSIEDYDYDLYEGEYDSMRSSLSLHQPEGEEFDLYWNVADAYRYYSQYSFWTLAGEQGLDGADEAARYRGLLLSIYEKSDAQAREIIEGFAGELASRP